MPEQASLRGDGFDAKGGVVLGGSLEFQIRSGEVENLDARSWGQRLEVEMREALLVTSPAGATQVSCFQDGPRDLREARAFLVRSVDYGMICASCTQAFLERNTSCT